MMEWISVKTALPDYEEIVLCWNGKYWERAWFDRINDHHLWFIDEEGVSINGATHWMRIEAPKED